MSKRPSGHYTRVLRRNTMTGRAFFAVVAAVATVSLSTVATTARFTTSSTVNLAVEAFQMSSDAPVLTLGAETDTSVAFDWPTREYATGYEFQYRVNGGAWSAIQSSDTPSGAATPGGGASVEIQARDSAPNNKTSWSAAVIGYTTPVATNVAGSVESSTAASATFDWPDAANADHYEYRNSINGGAWSSTVASAISDAVVAASAGDQVGLEVRTVNPHGVPGPWSTLLVAYLVPPAPAVVAGEATASDVAFTWAAVQHADHYEYQSSIDGGAWSAVTPVADTAISVPTTPGAKVEIQVRAINPTGQTGEWSGATAGYATPDTPTVTPGIATNASASFSWTPVTGADRYEYQSRTNGGAWSGPTATTDVTAAISGANAAELEVQVRAVSPSGQASSWSAAAAGYLVPPAPTGLVANNAAATATGVGFSWSPVPNTLRYEFQWQDNGGAWSAITANGVSTSWTGSPGANAVENVQVRAVNQSGQAGGWSSVATGYTLNTAPTVASSGVTTTAATLSWSASGANTSSYNWHFGSSGNLIHSAAMSNTQSGTPGQGIGYSVCGVNPAGVEGACSVGSVTLQNVAPVLRGTQYYVTTYSGRPQFELVLAVTETSYNVAANTSTISWTLYLEMVSVYKSYNLNNVGAWSANINGSGYSGGHNTDARTWSAGQTQVLYSSSMTVAHAADGSLSINVSGYDSPGAPFGTASVGGTFGPMSDLR